MNSVITWRSRYFQQACQARWYAWRSMLVSNNWAPDLMFRLAYHSSNALRQRYSEASSVVLVLAKGMPWSGVLSLELLLEQLVSVPRNVGYAAGRELAHPRWLGPSALGGLISRRVAAR